MSFVVENDYSKITNVMFGDFDWSGYPNFPDVFIISADYEGMPMNKFELDILNTDTNFIRKRISDYIHEGIGTGRLKRVLGGEKVKNK